MADTRRLFFALWPEPAVRDAIARTGLGIARERALGGREIPAERMHLTVLFLGACTADQLDLLRDGAARVRANPFHLRLDRAGCFFRSRVFWVGASVAPIGLTVLWRALQQVAAAAGIEPDRKVLVPHVTQVRDIRHRIRPMPIDPIGWQVRSFALVQSESGTPPAAGVPGKDRRSPAPSSRAAYHVVSQWPLQDVPDDFVKTVQGTGGPE